MRILYQRVVASAELRSAYSELGHRRQREAQLLAEVSRATRFGLDPGQMGRQEGDVVSRDAS